MAQEKINSFTQLTAWQKAHSLVLSVYGAAESFPASEQFGLTSQLKRAAVSISSNIAEGFSRRTKADKTHFYHMSLGSCTEVQNQLIIAKDLKFIPSKTFQDMANLTVEVNKLLNGLIKSLKVKP
ncbi:MAG: four helix bundle protein [Candidatus Saccharimonadales bacterium]